MNRLIYILLFVFSSSYGQEINHFSFNDLYDFNVSTIFDIDQCDDQVMWFGTSEGLVSFDGVKFRKFINEDYAISYTNIKFDEKGRVWCSNFGGQLFYLEKDSLKLALNWSNNGQFISDYDIKALPSIRIVGSNTGEIIEYDIDDLESKNILFSTEGVKIFSLSTPEGQKYAVHEYSDELQKGTLKVYNSGFLPSEKNLEGVYDVDIPPGKWSLFANDDEMFISSVQESGEIFSIGKDTIELIRELDLSTYSFNDVDIIDGRIWILSKRGISVYEKDGTPYLTDFLDGFSASALFKDHEGNIWVSSLNRGIIIIPNMEFRSLEISENSIAHSTSDEDGNIYAIDDRGSLFKVAPPYGADNISLLSQGELEPAPLFYDLRLNKLFIGNFRHFYNLKSNRLERKELIGNQSSMLFKSTDYIGAGYYVNTYYSQAYLVSINESGEHPLNFQLQSDNLIRKFRSKYVGSPVSKSGVYIDYIDGLFYYDITKPPQRVQWKKRDIQSAEIVPDPIQKDVVWISTKSKELLKLNKGEVVKSIDLPSVAHKIALNERYIFLASQNGIFRMDRASAKMELIDETDGWIKGRITSLKLHNGECVVAGSKYVQKFPIDYQTENQVKPKVFITDIIVEDSSYEMRNEMFLPPGSDFITFHFRGLSVRSQKKLTYQYRLSNQSKEWITTSYENPEARFLNLEGGAYQFEVRVCNESGTCSDTEYVEFTIQSPYYRQWWFFVIVFSAIALTIFLILRYRFRSKEKQEQLKSEQQRLRKEIYKSKIAAIRSQMNPHFIFNALNTIQEFILTNQQNVASEYLADFADLMRMYLDQSKEDNVTLSEEEDTLKLYLRLENLRLNEELDFSITFDPMINKDGTFIPVMLLQPYIENSLKHGLLHKNGHKKLSISFEQTEDKGIKCIIQDNGVGRAASAKINAAKSIGHKSFATGANDNRVELINKNRDKKIKVDIIDLYENDEPSGTRVVILIQ